MQLAGSRDKSPKVRHLFLFSVYTLPVSTCTGRSIAHACMNSGGKINLNRSQFTRRTPLIILFILPPTHAYGPLQHFSYYPLQHSLHTPSNTVCISTPSNTVCISTPSNTVCIPPPTQFAYPLQHFAYPLQHHTPPPPTQHPILTLITLHTIMPSRNLNISMGNTDSGMFYFSFSFIFTSIKFICFSELITSLIKRIERLESQYDLLLHQFLVLFLSPQMSLFHNPFCPLLYSLQLCLALVLSRCCFFSSCCFLRPMSHHTLHPQASSCQTNG